jgi:chromosome segregation ATPase
VPLMKRNEKLAGGGTGKGGFFSGGQAQKKEFEATKAELEATKTELEGLREEHEDNLRKYKIDSDKLDVVTQERDDLRKKLDKAKVTAKEMQKELTDANREVMNLREEARK